MKRLFRLFCPLPLLFAACSDRSMSGGEPASAESAGLREECEFVAVDAVPSDVSAEFSAEYRYLGGFRVQENGFVCTPSGGEAVTVVCERSSTPRCTLGGLQPETDYAVCCYVIAGGRTFRSRTVLFATSAGDGTGPAPVEKIEFGPVTVSDRGGAEVAVAVDFVCEGVQRVVDAGFVLRRTDTGTETRSSCAAADGSLRHVFSGLSAGASYAAEAYIETAQRMWRSAPTDFTAAAAGGTPDPGGGRARYEGWAELPAETAHAGWHYIYHMRPDVPSVRNFSLCYSSEYRCAVWAAMAVHDAWNGSAGRNDTWRYDPDLEESLQPDLRKTYSGVYSRGHMIASSDRQVSVAANKQIFYYTNMAPQYQNEFNGGIWNKLEKRVWSNYNCADTLYVVTGAHFAGACGSCTDAAGNRVTVPTHFYKVLLRSKSGCTGRWVGQLRADELQCVGFWLPHNDAYSTKADVTEQYLVPVSYVEEQTGLLFFSNVPAAPKTTFDKADWGY